MNSVKVAFFEIKEWEKEYIMTGLKNTEASFFAEKITLENVSSAQDCHILSVFVDSQVTKNILDKLPNLKMIATRSTGFDHIDIEECKKRNIIVCNVPHYGDNSVAEHAFALILDLSRKIHQSIENVKSGGFSFNGLTGFDLKDKTLGIVGLGNIGQRMARIARGFEMNVIGFDVNPNKRLAKQLGFTYVTFEELLKNADIVTLHVPYNQHTHHLINEQNISLMKKGAYLINTSRGGVVQTDALMQALNSGALAGAGLDVLEEEAALRDEIHLLSTKVSDEHNIKVLLENHMLMERENVIITPHNAFNSKEALEKILETTVLNIQSFLKGKVINVV